MLQIYASTVYEDILVQTARLGQRLRLPALLRSAGRWLEGAREPGAARLGREGATKGGGSGQQHGGRQRARMLPWLLFRTARRAVLGSVETELCGELDPWMSGKDGINEDLKSIKESCHNFCTAVSTAVTYKELKNLLNSKNIMLIDVRETWEILEYGKIPGSVNIPLNEVSEALQMNPRDFKEKYHEVKPSKSDSLVFSCLAGRRSKKALDTAISLGFHRAQHYAGGWKEWETYEFSENKKGN
ncbi:thiosulfate sulfurtransferase/rhodanese-like domain-containing protein 3 [Callospermophilus lateralis]|uniref:thiosulfate sulfurtransferase/rhodanese-like domain-containing protein 3 n=2 Tax=Callospermophilus lateralis TaxID=76772 RepID=UPI0040541AA4